MRVKKWVIIPMLLGIFCVIGWGATVQAAEKSDDMAYTVTAKLPDSQVNSSVSYFDLQLSPGSKETVALHIKNSGTEKSTYTIRVNQATTNKNGVIDYSGTPEKLDGSLKYQLADIVSPAKKEITIDAGKEMDVPFEITMPAEKFEGIILGGFYVQKQNKEQVKEKTDEAVMINNRYAFVVGLSLQNAEDNREPDLRLVTAKAGLNNSYTAVLANFQNPMTKILRKLAIQAAITKKGQQEVLYKVDKSGMAMAPNSNFDLPISLNKETIKPGTYTLHVNASAEDQKYKWTFTKDFTIKADKARKLNEKAVEVKKNHTWLIYVIVGIFILLLIIIVLLVMKLRRSKNTDSKS
ncbi:hypothetical protein BAU15_01590 [Enterococcus sp. JM4C]|uniref:DUF916 and DUF3324 domain-containing protein n=1 Tax=Candidatus Enterococcus huntleyi TaxID=1857217 RepID=UPI00137957C8|nr:DUF916 and DUF3324 domain-containing protein [Enterococcus sp. JM4C]KAF1299366.1 hypothetical protein BAU15_01590 [Enterococcus sp. JM4C]